MRDAALVLAAGAIGAGTGWAFDSSAAIVVTAVVAVVLGLVSVWAQVRRLVALAVIVGTAVGALVGRSIVHTLCLPGGCLGLEIVAAVVTAAGALVGVGLVVALATRSFDEYQEGLAARQMPGDPPDDDPIDPGS
jgi:hypothetical protein